MSDRTPARRLLLATRSTGKLRELRPIIEAAGFDPVDLDDVGIPASADEAQIESHETFEENALAKARHFHRLSGLPTIADDSGLMVDALGGAPGVRSKRWSGRTDLEGQALDDANNRRLLERLEGESNRRARYVCVGAFVDGTVERVARGETVGAIVDEARGSGGFGYDPFFFSEDLGVTFGEATRDAKEAVSHRGRAMRALMQYVGVGR